MATLIRLRWFVLAAALIGPVAAVMLWVRGEPSVFAVAVIYSAPALQAGGAFLMRERLKMRGINRDWAVTTAFLAAVTWFMVLVAAMGAGGGGFLDLTPLLVAALAILASVLLQIVALVALAWKRA